VDTVAINAMRRSGELVATRPAQSQEWYFPAWQFGPDGRVRPEVAEALAAARKHGVRPDELAAILDRRAGLTGGGTLRDELLAGRLEHVLDAIRAAA
jgi:hypothetical protein